MYYIKNGLNKNWHWLAYLFAAFGVLTVFGTGNATQVNTITTAIDSALFNYGVIGVDAAKTVNLVIGIVLAVLIALILLGGIKRIGTGNGKACTVHGGYLCSVSCRSGSVEFKKYTTCICFNF